MINQNTYSEDIKNFTKITSIESEEILSTKNLVVIYIGRESCPYCRIFARKLSGLIPQIKTNIYYIDTSDMSDIAISNFRDKYSIRTVPGFIVSKDSIVKIVCDSSTPENDLLDLIN